MCHQRGTLNALVEDGATAMLMKIYGGTEPQTNESLCDTCRHSQIVRGRRLEEEIVFCQAVPMESVRIRFKVTSCTDYFDQRVPSVPELYEKAWILQPASRRRPAGFVRAADLRRGELGRLISETTEDV